MTPDDAPSVSRPSVFISYAHDGEPFRATVDTLAAWLKARGFNVITDLPFRNRPPAEGWQMWMLHTIQDADFVLMVCTPKFKARFERKAPRGEGFGAMYEGAIVTQLLYTSLAHNEKFFPIVPDGGSPEHVPTLLRGWFNGHQFPSGNTGIEAMLMDVLPDPRALDTGIRDASPSSAASPTRPPPSAEDDKLDHRTRDHRDPAWRDLIVDLGSGTPSVVQRFLWIEPGEFLMGSPENEPGRSRDEGPRHRVTLTRGFWLAETACTQAFWKTVMGVNRSRFKGHDRPVENVSWFDVQRFLSRLEERSPGCGARLPTEAEWEYACRAGTDTAFSFGASITPEQVNYDGCHPYAGGAEGLYRRATVAVKSLPANRWGLYEMHGNVWEWCADGMRGYKADDMVDPCGPVIEDPGQHAIIRGGSWYEYGVRARSASRGTALAGGARDDLGFRFCLRSAAPDPVRSAEPPGPPAERADGLDALRRTAAGRAIIR